MRRSILKSDTRLQISASKYGLYEQCQKCFYLKYILKMPSYQDDRTYFQYGNAVHNTIENMTMGVNDLVPMEEFSTENVDKRELKYNSYLRHIELARDMFSITSEDLSKVDILCSEIEFVYDSGRGYDFYGYLDGLVIDASARDFLLSKGSLIAVDGSKVENGIVVRFFEDELGNVTHEVGSPGDFLGYPIKRVLEMKSQDKKWSYNEIRQNNQFTIYNKLNEIAFGGKLFQLVNFYRSPEAGIQKERIVKTDHDYEKLLEKCDGLVRTIETGVYIPISTCGYTSRYKDICSSFTI